MNLKDFLVQVIATLEDAKVRYALAGGLAASIYREKERITKDLDFLILADIQTQDRAETIIESFGLTPFVIRKADMEGGPLFAIKKKDTPPYFVAGRAQGDASKIELDFILPAIPWFANALNRAELNRIDFGFAKIPCLTIEDIILSKFYAANNDSRRFTDLDDLKSIFEAKHELDLAYLSGQMQKLEFPVPKSIEDLAPKALSIISKKIRRKQ
jgi:hypothetical protein